MSEIEIIYPTAPLNEAQRQLLISRPNRIPIGVVAGYVMSGFIGIDDMPLLDDNRKETIKNLMNQPSPQEKKDWEDISSYDVEKLSSEEAQKLKTKIEEYIALPPKMHIEDAQEKLNAVKQKIEDYEIEAELEKEKIAYEELNKDSYDAVTEHLKIYPHSIHFKELDDSAYYSVAFNNDYKEYLSFLNDIPNTNHKNDIDNNIWEWVKGQKTIGALETFMKDVPWSAHYNEARQMVDEYNEWASLDSDILAVKNYLDKHPNSPFKEEVNRRLQKLKEIEVAAMKMLRDKYSYEKYCLLKDKQVFTEQELIDLGVLTRNIVSRLNNTLPLPDLTKHFLEGQSHFACPPKHTDVYLFGIPSTGKTCILMSLLKGCGLDFQSKKYAGGYASDLVTYLNAGKLPKRTEGDYVAIINGEIPNEKGESHHVNLIEMSGEEFALGIAKNKKVKLEDFGTGTTNLLRNDNRKVFFIVFDPTVDTIEFNQNVYKKDADGEYIYDDEGKRLIDYINKELLVQSAIIQNIIDLFKMDENKDIMKKVDAIHIIATKADMLDSIGDADDSRTEKAVEIFRGQCQGSIDKLKRFIKNFEGKALNYSTEGDVYLFPFSLGQFYIGGLYEHDATSAREIVKVIQSITLGTRQQTWWEKFKDKLN